MINDHISAQIIEVIGERWSLFKGAIVCGIKVQNEALK
jgi:hypothetical protein